MAVCTAQDPVCGPSSIAGRWRPRRADVSDRCDCPTLAGFDDLPGNDGAIRPHAHWRYGSRFVATGKNQNQSARHRRLGFESLETRELMASGNTVFAAEVPQLLARASAASPSNDAIIAVV